MLWRIMPVALLAPSLQQLEHAKRELEKANAELEYKVQERTLELVNANATLQSALSKQSALHEDLQRKKALLRGVINNIPDLIFFKDTHGTYLGCNKAFEDYFGATENEIIGKSDFDFVDTETAKFFRQKDKEILSSHEVHTNEEWATYPDGCKVCLDTLNTLFKNEHDEICGIIGVSRNITERKNTETLLMNAKAAAETANRVKSEFLSNASHELRTPLNAILGYAQMLALCSDDTTLGKERRSLQCITESGWHLLRLINDLLDLSVIEANKLEVSMGNVALQPCIDECMDIVRPLAEQREITLNDPDSDGASLFVQADSFRLKLVLTNLLSNAVKYNHHGGRVTVKCTQRASGKIRIAVTDTGTGLTEEEQKILFQPFVRLEKHMTNTEGTGIGLVVSQQLIRLMDGEIGIESQRGQDATFWIELSPAENAINDVPTPEKISQPLSLNLTTLQPAQVLYIPHGFYTGPWTLRKWLRN